MLVGDVRSPRVIARVVSHGPEKGHEAVGSHDRGRGESKLAVGNELGQAEDDDRHAPYDVARGHERLALAEPVAYGAEEDSRDGRGDGGRGHHP